jgi:acetate kinase
LSGKTGDVKTVREAAATGDAMAVLAMKIFTRSVIKAIGGFCWLLGGVDAIVFTGGIGEHDEMTRADILANLQDLGVAIDVRPNRAKSPALRQIGTATSNTTVYVVPSQEDRMIAVHVQRMSSLKK